MDTKSITNILITEIERAGKVVGGDGDAITYAFITLHPSDFAALAKEQLAAKELAFSSAGEFELETGIGAVSARCGSGVVAGEVQVSLCYVVPILSDEVEQ